MNKNEIALSPTYWASVSGGKDSLFMLKLILEHPEKYPLDGVIHFDLEIDYPFIKKVIDYMQRECETRGIQFVRVKPRKSWFSLYDRNGFPTRKARWCLGEYKLDALRQLEEFMKQQNKYVVSYIGYCADESDRIIKHRDKKPQDRYPLDDYNIKEDFILEWAKQTPIFNDYYKINRRCGCMYCPMICYTEMAYMCIKYPDNFNTLMSMAKVTEIRREKELGRPFSIWQSNPKYNTDYVIERVKTKFVPIVLEKIKNIGG